MTNKLTYLFSAVLIVSGLSACDTKTETKPESPTTKTTAESTTESTTKIPSETTEMSKPSNAASAINIVNPRIRALPPGQKVTAMYMQLNNTSANEHELVKVEGNISDMIELHAHTNNNGVMQMGQVESIPVSANSSVEAKPGGYHVMIMGLKKDLKIGEKFDFNLTFKDGSTKSITAEIKTLEVN